jgi:hypothetical protein
MERLYIGSISRTKLNDKLRVALADAAREPSDREIMEARLFTRKLTAENRELFDMLARL